MNGQTLDLVHEQAPTTSELAKMTGMMQDHSTGIVPTEVHFKNVRAVDPAKCGVGFVLNMRDYPEYTLAPKNRRNLAEFDREGEVVQDGWERIYEFARGHGFTIGRGQP